MARRAAPSLTGQTLRERFLVGELLGQGGQCRVYRCERLADREQAETARCDDRARYAPHAARTPRHAALKVFQMDGSSKEEREIFFGEYRVQARINARRVVRTYESFASDSSLCMTLDLMPGGSLSAYQGKPLPVGMAVGLALQLFEGLSVLHARGVVHRDIKPGNLLLEEPLDFVAMSGEGDRPAARPLAELRIADFGIADVQDMAFGDRGFHRIRGTLQFMAPELVGRDTVDARVDIYAAGVTLFYLLTGYHPLSRTASKRKSGELADSSSSPDLYTSELALPNEPSTALAIQGQLFSGQGKHIDVRAVAPEIPDELAALVASLIAPDPAARPRTAAMAFSLLYEWFLKHASSHGVRLAREPEVCFDPYLAASSFCGREKELAAATLFFTNLRNQELLPGRSTPEGLRLSLAERRQRSAPSIVRIFGESGSGKSRFCKQISRHIQGEYRLIHIQADRELGAYQRVLKLRDEFEASYLERLDAARSDPGTMWKLLHDPDDAFYVPDLESGTDSRFAALRGQQVTDKERAELSELFDLYRSGRFAAILRLLSYEHPLCFLIEDAQWLDRASMRLIGAAMRFLAGSRADGFAPRVAFIVNHRPKEEGDQLDYVLEQLSSVANIEQPAVVIELSAFKEEDAESLVVSMLGLEGAVQREAAREYVKALATRRPLTPLSVEQSLWSLFSDGNLIKRDSTGRWNGDWNLSPALISEASAPLSVRDAIGQRAARFDTQTLRILGIAAVAGKSFDVELVARAAELEGKDALAALDLAGRVGFVRQLEGSSQEYLSDLKNLATTYVFLHDRYREAIVAALPVEASVRMHSAIARAIKARFGENEATWEQLAEHHFGAAEFHLAYPYAEKIGAHAFANMQDEQAARNYGAAILSRSKLNERVPLDVLDRCAQSLEALGRFAEAQVHLRTLLSSPELAQAARMDAKRRIAEGALRQQDYKNALLPLLELLKEDGISIPPKSLSDLFSQLQGVFYWLTVPYFPAFLRHAPADDLEVAEQLQRALLSIMETGVFVESKISAAAFFVLFQKGIRQGLTRYTPIIFASGGYVAGMMGFYAHSRRCDALSRQLAPQYGKEAADRAVDRVLSQRDATLISNKFYRGELGRSHDAELTQLLANGLATSQSCGDLQRRWVFLATAAWVGSASGRIAVFQALMNSLMTMSTQSGLGFLRSLYGAFTVGVLADLAGQDDRASAAWEQALATAREQGNLIDKITLTGMNLFSRSRLKVLIDADVSKEALSLVREWITRRFSIAFVVGFGCLVAAAALFEYRSGRTAPSPELREILKLARPPCMRERQITPYYIAAQATVAAMKGDGKQTAALLSHASDCAVEWGFLGHQLTAVLRIAKWILPAGSHGHTYFTHWDRNLTANLMNQEPVDIKQIEQGRLPPAPADGRPSSVGT